MLVKSLFKYAYTATFWHYNDNNVYCRELAPGTVSLTGDDAQGDDNKQCAYSTQVLL